MTTTNGKCVCSHKKHREREICGCTHDPKCICPSCKSVPPPQEGAELYTYIPLDGHPGKFGLSGPGFIGNTNIRALELNLVANTAFSQGRASRDSEVAAMKEELEHWKELFNQQLRHSTTCGVFHFGICDCGALTKYAMTQKETKI